MPNAARRRTTCRVCGGTDLSTFLDLGTQPPANSLLHEDELKRPEPQFPLALMRCARCELIQLTHTVDPDVLFKDYKYFSSVSGAMVQHFAALAAHVADRFVPPDGLVVELGSNDGILLRSLLDRKVRILGVDPAETVAEAARKRGVPTLAEYFTEAVARRIASEHGQASAIHANNVFAHIDDLDQVMRGVAHLLSDQGAFVIEAPYVVDFLEHLELDTVYHEHVSYLGVRPLTVLFGRYGFEVFEVQRQSVHGGTIRVFARKQREGAPPAHPSVAECLALETQAGTSDPARLDEFARRVAALRAELCALVGRLRAEGKRVAGYTAPAKATVLLNYCGFTTQDIAYLADATPAKQGLYVPGVRIPIRTPEHFHQDRPDYALLSAWNHRSEILAKESAYREAGGRFIIPIPKVEVV